MPTVVRRIWIECGRRFIGFAIWMGWGKDLLNRVQNKGKRGALMIQHMGIFYCNGVLSLLVALKSAVHEVLGFSSSSFLQQRRDLVIASL